jgi:uncharacterized protein (DUF58 family)
MIGDYLPFLLFLIFVAAFLRDDFAFTLVYLFVGVFLVGIWWSRRAISAVTFKRSYTKRAFLGEKIDIKLQVNNIKWLPIPWLRIRDGLPVQLSGPESFSRVLTLAPKSTENFAYTLEARSRGYYSLGPLFISTGDLLGLGGSELQNEGKTEFLTVYPKIVPLIQIRLPSRSPLGTLRHNQPVFEDPTRVLGKRDYIPGDSLRRVDWKTTAVTGRMQIKLFEPSMALDTLIILDLQSQNYHYRTRIDSTELAIVIAASIANWITRKGQTVGLYTNAEDPQGLDNRAQFLPPKSGKAHLIQILETLARIQTANINQNLAAQIQKQRLYLPWGTTLIVITGNADDSLLDELYQARRAGQNTLLILAGRAVGVRDTQTKAAYFGIPVLPIVNEDQLERWGHGREIAI